MAGEDAQHRRSRTAARNRVGCGLGVVLVGVRVLAQRADRLLQHRQPQTFVPRRTRQREFCVGERRDDDRLSVAETDEHAAVLLLHEHALQGHRIAMRECAHRRDEEAVAERPLLARIDVRRLVEEQRALAVADLLETARVAGLEVGLAQRWRRRRSRRRSRRSLRRRRLHRLAGIATVRIVGRAIRIGGRRRRRRLRSHLRARRRLRQDLLRQWRHLKLAAAHHALQRRRSRGLLALHAMADAQCIEFMLRQRAVAVLVPGVKVHDDDFGERPCRRCLRLRGRRGVLRKDSEQQGEGQHGRRRVASPHPGAVAHAPSPIRSTASHPTRRCGRTAFADPNGRPSRPHPGWLPPARRLQILPSI